MPKAPRFPRPTEIVIMPNGQRLQMAPAFARWLDELVRQADVGAEFFDLEGLSPVSFGAMVDRTARLAPVARQSGPEKALAPLSRASAPADSLAPLTRPCAPKNGLAPI